MELLYLYIEEYKIFKKKEFKFSDKIFIKKKLNEKGNLTKIEVIREKEKYYFKYAKNVSNVTGIIGLNGTGKSLLLEVIEKALNYITDFSKEDYEELKIAFVYEVDEEIYLEKINLEVESNQKEAIHCDFRVFKNKKENLVSKNNSIKILNFLKSLPDNEDKWNYILKDNFPNRIIKNGDYNNAINKEQWILYGKRLRFDFDNFKDNNLEFEYHLSTGEEILFNLFSQIKEFENDFFYQEGDEDGYVSRGCYNLIVLLDEPEISLHLEWQRNFFSDLLKMLSVLFNVNIQIFMATHSPFILSDLFDKNIIYLDKIQSEIVLHKTFGANIFDILKNDFFMSSFIGEYSKQEIKKIIEWMTKDKNNKYIYEKELEENKKRIKYIINFMGESLIKNKLEKMYIEYENLINNKKEKKEIIELEKYLKNRGLTVEEALNIISEHDKNMKL